uniref:Odorant binding protein 1 n=1 Tax=Oobius agrili TaxID=2023209 RepID=A0A386AT29_9HYME|nr:odorant binding protein 1 [Oobius agrili]
MNSLAVISIATVCLVAAALGLEHQSTIIQPKDHLEQQRNSCINETGVDEALIERVRKREEVQADTKLNCFYECMLKKITIMKSDGTIDKEVARTQITANTPNDKIDEVFNTCTTQAGNGTCETGGNVMGCLLKYEALTIFD